MTLASSSNPRAREPGGGGFGFWATGYWQGKLVQGLRAWGGALETQFINSCPLLVIDLASSSNSTTRETEARHREGRPYVQEGGYA